MHLPGEANSLNGLPVVPAFLAQGRHQVFRCLPPGRRGLFRPVGMWPLNSQRRAVAGDDVVIFINDQRLHF